MNPDMAAMAESALARGYDVLILTNAMKPMMRPRVQAALVDLNAASARSSPCASASIIGAPICTTKSAGRTASTKRSTGLRWLRDHGIRARRSPAACAGATATRTCARATRALFAREDLAIDADDHAALVIFPEMDARVDVPEITVDCWRILNKSPNDVMCAIEPHDREAQGRCVARRCSPARFCPTIHSSNWARPWRGLAPVKLNHPHCAKFCVLGGGSCKA